MLRPVGDIRRVDRLGRIVIPVNVRKMFDLQEGSPLEMFIDGDKIVFRKYISQCAFCGSSENLKSLNDNFICESCLAKLNNK